MRKPTHQFDRMAWQKCLDAMSSVLFPFPTNATVAIIEKRLASIELHLQQLAQSPAQSSLTLTDLEQKILAALANKALKGAAIARRLGCGYNSSFKSTLSLLVRTGVLGKGRQGYFVAPKSGHVRIDATKD